MENGFYTLRNLPSHNDFAFVFAMLLQRMFQKNVCGVVPDGYKSTEFGENPLICSKIVSGEQTRGWAFALTYTRVTNVDFKGFQVELRIVREKCIAFRWRTWFNIRVEDPNEMWHDSML
jgi:hypothetical protein